MSTVCSRRRRRTLFWEETLKTTLATTRNWNVNGLLGEVEDRWHFRQLLRQLRFANRVSRREVLEDDPAHVDNCSATSKSASKKRRTSTSCSSISGTRTSRDGTSSALSSICSTVCRCARSCGLTPAKRSGRDPLDSSSNNSKNSGWRVGSSGSSPCGSSRTHLPLLACFCPRGAVWWSLSARNHCDG